LKISVIISTYNSSEYLLKVLYGLPVIYRWWLYTRARFCCLP